MMSVGKKSALWLTPLTSIRRLSLVRGTPLGMEVEPEVNKMTA